MNKEPEHRSRDDGPHQRKPAGMIDVKLPQFGMGMAEGTIVAWHKAEGDAVAKGEAIADVKLPKPSPKSPRRRAARWQRY
jgi:hypothetical protein